uniref:Uncharacterized protein n=1 Tax=Oryza glumipatula TaxID=40148 RepID=A0A0D9Z6T2_9ORYZ
MVSSYVTYQPMVQCVLDLLLHQSVRRNQAEKHCSRASSLVSNRKKIWDSRSLSTYGLAPVTAQQRHHYITSILARMDCEQAICVVESSRLLIPLMPIHLKGMWHANCPVLAKRSMMTLPMRASIMRVNYTSDQVASPQAEGEDISNVKLRVMSSKLSPLSTGELELSILS